MRGQYVGRAKTTTEMKLVNWLYSRNLEGQYDRNVDRSTDILWKGWDEIGGIGAKMKLRHKVG